MKYARLKSELDNFIERSRKQNAPALVIANDTGKYRVPLKSNPLYTKPLTAISMVHTEQENIICYKA